MLILLVLASALGYAAGAVLLLRALTGQWPDRIVPGSHAYGWHESSALAEGPPRPTLLERARALLPTRTRTPARAPGRLDVPTRWDSAAVASFVD